MKYHFYFQSTMSFSPIAPICLSTVMTVAVAPGTDGIIVAGFIEQVGDVDIIMSEPIASD
ncbi:hypothetical protein N7478_012032 [Penicillium angulare]|uniref:uncharacterized protein n=1 Tax=Penicillium angulare TaxID=116970 RepID=UPI00253F96E0|nr:uncharacterized protein N7478_012032 [Penicillium angulare]KAJ5261437.1 hypothetical protein N7478_012032 [Penicillium angulare]